MDTVWRARNENIWHVMYKIIKFAVLLKGLQSLFTDCFSLIHLWICWSSYSLPYLPHQCISKPLASFALICVYSQSYYYLQPTLFLFMANRICIKSTIHFWMSQLSLTMWSFKKLWKIWRKNCRSPVPADKTVWGWVCSGTGKLWRGNFVGNQI